LTALRDDHPKTGRRLLVSLEFKRRVTQDGIEILPFLRALWNDEIA